MNLQGIPLFEVVDTPKTDTLLQNLSTANQGTPLFYYLCIETKKIMNKYGQKKKWLVSSKYLQGITIFQDVTASKAETLLQNLATNNKITPNKQLFSLSYHKPF